jgi:hypothetical protein
MSSTLALVLMAGMAVPPQGQALEVCGGGRVGGGCMATTRRLPTGRAPAGVREVRAAGGRAAPVAPQRGRIAGPHSGAGPPMARPSRTRQTHAWAFLGPYPGGASDREVR